MARVLATAVHVWHDGDYVVLSAGAELPEWATDLVTNPKALVEVEDGAEKASDEPKGYVDLSKDELAAALKERELPTSGNKAELVARLEQDDVEKAEEPDENEE